METVFSDISPPTMESPAPAATETVAAPPLVGKAPERQGDSASEVTTEVPMKTDSEQCADPMVEETSQSVTSPNVPERQAPSCPRQGCKCWENFSALDWSTIGSLYNDLGRYHLVKWHRFQKDKYYILALSDHDKDYAYAAGGSKVSTAAYAIISQEEGHLIPAGCRVEAAVGSDRAAGISLGLCFTVVGPHQFKQPGLLILTKAHLTTLQLQPRDPIPHLTLSKGSRKPNEVCWVG